MCVYIRNGKNQEVYLIYCSIIAPPLNFPDVLIGSSDHTPIFLGFGTEFNSRSSSNESANALIDVPLFGLSFFGSITGGEFPVESEAAARRPFLADYKQ